MMKIYKPFLLISLVSVVFAGTLRAQLEVVFDTSYQVSVHDTVLDMALTSEGDCMILGATDANDSTFTVRSMMFLLKVSGSNGDSLLFNSHEFDTTFSTHAIYPLSDGDFLIPGSFLKNGRIFRVDGTGEIVDTYAVPDSTNFFRRVMEMPNGELIVIQSKVENKNFSKLMRMTPAWDTIWDTGFTPEEYDGLAYYNEDRIIASGWDNNKEYPHPTITAYSPDGDSLYYNKINEVYALNKNIFIDTNTLLLVNTKQYLISGTVGNIVRVDELGNYIWYEDLKSPGSPDVGGIFIYHDYVLAASETVGVGDSLIISVINGDGSLINALTLDKVEPKVAAMQQIGGNLLITGTELDTTNNTGIRVFLTSIAIDSSWFTITVGWDEVLAENGIKLYPNPASDQITLQIDDALYGENTVYLFNSSGVLQREYRFRGAKFETPVSQLPNGLYFFKLVRPDGQASVHKIVVMH